MNPNRNLRVLAALMLTFAAELAAAGTLTLTPSFSPNAVGINACPPASPEWPSGYVNTTLTVGYACSGACAAPTITVGLPPGLQYGNLLGDSKTTSKSAGAFGSTILTDTFNQGNLPDGWTSQVQVADIRLQGPLYNYPHNLTIPVTITSADSATVTQNVSLPVTAMACSPTLYVRDYVGLANRQVAIGDSIPWSANTFGAKTYTGAYYPLSSGAYDGTRAIVGPATLTMVLPAGANATPGTLCYADWTTMANHPNTYNSMTPVCDPATSIVNNNSSSPVVITWTLPAGKVAFPNSSQTGTLVVTNGVRYANADVVFPSSNALNVDGRVVRACTNWTGYTWGGSDMTYAPTADGLTPLTLGTLWDGSSTPTSANDCSVPLVLKAPIVKPVATKTGSNDATSTADAQDFTIHTGVAALTDSISFSLGLNNQGNTTLQNVVLQDDLPAWFMFTGFSGFPASAAGDPATSVSSPPAQALLYQTNLSKAADPTLWYTLPAANYLTVCSTVSAYNSASGNKLCSTTEHVTNIKIVTARDLLPGFALGTNNGNYASPALALNVTTTNNYYISGVVLQTGWDSVTHAAGEVLTNTSTATVYTNAQGTETAYSLPYQLTITDPHPAIAAATDRYGQSTYVAGSTTPACYAGFSTGYGGLVKTNIYGDLIGGGTVTGPFTISASFPDFLLPANGTSYDIKVYEGWWVTTSADPQCPSKTLTAGTDYSTPVVIPNYMGTGRTLVTVTLPSTLSLPSGTITPVKNNTQCAVGMAIGGMKVSPTATAGAYTCQVGVTSGTFYPDANSSISSPDGSALRQFADGSITQDYGLGTAAFDWGNDGTSQQVHWTSKTNFIAATPSATLTKSYDGSTSKLAGSVVNYTLNLGNPGNDYLTGFDIVDVLPTSSDGRTSTAALALTGALSTGTLPSGASLTITYATDTNPCRPSVTTGCTTATWLAAGAVTNWSTIHSIRLQGTGFNIVPFTGFWTFTYPLTIPIDTADGAKIVNDAQFAPTYFSSTTPASSSNQPYFIVIGMTRLTVTKNITGVAASVIASDLSFPFTVSCGNPTASYTGTVTVAASTLTGSSVVRVPVGSTGCTLTEGTLPTAPTNYEWGTASYSTLANPISSDSSGTITNPLSRILISVTISKSVTGAPSAGAPGDYGFSLACDTGTYTGTVTIASGTSGSATVSVPQGATCTTLTETSKATAPTNYSWDAETTTPPAGTVATGATGSIVNPLTRNQISVTISKSVTGAPSAGAPGSYGFSLACDTGTYTGTVTIASGTSGSATVSVPQGATCTTLTETGKATAPTNYSWDAETTTPPAGTIATGATGSIVNPLTRILISVTISKSVTGAPSAGAPGDYGFSLACDTGTYAGTITIASGTSGSATVSVPQGATCTTLTETSKATAPTNFSWGTETTTPPAGTIAAGATGSIVNPLTPPRDPPFISKTARLISTNLVEWTITVVNNRATNAGGPPIAVNVSDVFPAGMTAVAGSVSCTPTTASGQTTVTSCGFSADNLSLTAATTLAYTSDSVAASASERVDIVFRGQLTGNTSITNQACASVVGVIASPVCAQAVAAPPTNTDTATPVPALDGRGLAVLSLLMLVAGLWLIRRNSSR